MCPLCNEAPDWPVEVKSEYTSKTMRFCTNCAKDVVEALFNERTITIRTRDGGGITVEVGP